MDILKALNEMGSLYTALNSIIFAFLGMILGLGFTGFLFSLFLPHEQRTYHEYEVPFTVDLEYTPNEHPYYEACVDEVEDSDNVTKCRFCGRRYSDLNCPYCGGIN